MTPTREIPLTQGKMAIVDAVDYEGLSQLKWQAQRTRCGFYAVHSAAGGRIKILMHRLIAKAPAGLKIDHADGNGLNNCRENIRLATNQQNTSNRKMNRNNSVGLKGVHKVYGGKWEARIAPNGKYIYLGLFATKELAAEAYDKAAREHFGEFARTNS